jgi:beta-galactosidase
MENRTLILEKSKKGHKIAFFVQLFIIFFVSFPNLLSAQTVTGEPAGIPRVPQVYSTEPWEDPSITSINRDPSRATAYSFQTEKDALSCDRNKTSRVMSLNGAWDFYFAFKPEDAPKAE